MDSSIRPDSTVTVTPGVTAVQLADEVNLYEPGSGTSVALNASAAAVFAQVTEGTETTVGDVSRALSSEHGVDLLTMTHDVITALTALAETGMVTIASDAPS